MKNFFQYIAPFAPDYSGAVAVLYETGALIVICDPGGCSGNVCGYDESRFYSRGGAIYSAALRDMDAIWGRDDRLADKIVSAAEYGNYELIALVGTPVVSVIATDLEAICRVIEERTGIRTISVDTNGMDYYDKGQEKARKALEKAFPGKYRMSYTPLDSMPTDEDLKRMCLEVTESAEDMLSREMKILVIHQKDAAQVMREKLNGEGFCNVTTGSWFKGCDMKFNDEELFIKECMKYDCICADPLFFDALKDFKGIRISFPHAAVSGDLFMEKANG